MSMSERGRIILCIDWCQQRTDRLGLGTTRLSGTLRHLNCAIHIMTNLVSITQSANLMTNSGLKEEGQRRKEVTLNYLVHTGFLLEQRKVATAVVDPVKKLTC